MTLALQIKEIYPNIDLENNVKLRDDGDGAYIEEWNYSKKQPTQAELDAVKEQAQQKEQEIKNKQQQAAQIIKTVSEDELILAVFGLLDSTRKTELTNQLQTILNS